MTQRFKIQLIIAACILSGLCGFGLVAKAALPLPPYGLGYHGYFLDQYAPTCPSYNGDTGDVINGGIPSSVDSANEFIIFIEGLLHSSARQAIGAAFIIQTMIGTARDHPPTSTQITEWENRVRYADAQGWIKWNVSFGYFYNSCYQGHYNNNHGPVDDMFWDEDGIVTTTGIQVKNSSGTVVYEIRRSCGNPVGVVTPLQNNPDYTLTGRTTVSSPTVYAGGSVTFKHYIKNSGPNTATTKWTTKDGNTNASIASGNNTVNSGAENNVNNETFVVPNNAAPGTTYCRYVSYTPSKNGSGTGQGAEACTTVIANFSVTPTVVASSATAQQNDIETFTYSIFNNGPGVTTDINCKAAGQTNGSGYTPQPAQDADRNPAVNPQPSFACNQPFPLGATQVAVETVDVGNAPVGSSICRSLVIDPKDQDGGYRASAEACVIIAKSPYVQFTGNDVWAGGGFSAITPQCNTAAKITTVSHVLSDGTVAGSAVEYGAFALDKITNFGSANKALGAAPAGVQLTFSNTNTSSLGFYGSPKHCINDYVTQFTKAQKDPVPAGQDINLSSQATGTQMDIVSAQPISIHGNLSTGSQQIYLIEGNVTISGNITYPGTYNNPSDIPSLVIIATGNITVNRNVQQLDGVFVSRGQFFTCDVALSTTLSTGPPCEKQLVVNGPVIAGQLQLLRTYGADGPSNTSRKNPAELFNYSPELYVRNALSGVNSNLLRTVNEQDLPPRF